jgi:hypothetical protein
MNRGLWTTLKTQQSGITSIIWLTPYTNLQNFRSCPTECTGKSEICLILSTISTNLATTIAWPAI